MFLFVFLQLPWPPADATALWASQDGQRLLMPPRTPSELLPQRHELRVALMLAAPSQRQPLFAMSLSTPTDLIQKSRRE